MKALVAAALCLCGPAYGAVDGCLLGTWQLVKTSFTQDLQGRLGPMQVDEARMIAIAVVGPDGAVTGTISDGYARLSQGGAAFEGIVSARFELVISTQNGQLRSEILDAKIDADIRMVNPNGVNPVIQEMNPGMEAIDERVHLHTYTCTRSELILKNVNGSSSPFEVWVRQ